ncbi:MAG TPA: hypothetical protein VIW29_05340, partial [Polyangiaceae bacterium]
MTKSALRSQLAVSVVALSASVLAESAARAYPALGSSALVAARDLVLTVGLWAWPAALTALVLAALLGALCGEDAPLAVLSDSWREPARRQRLVLAALLAPGLLLWVFEWTRAAARFHNVELAAALVAGAALAGVFGLALAGWGLLRALATPGLARRAVTGWSAALASGLGLGWLLWHARA